MNTTEIIADLEVAHAQTCELEGPHSVWDCPDEFETSTLRPALFTADDMKKLYKVGQRRTVTVRGVTWTQVFTADGEWWNIDLAL